MYIIWNQKTFCQSLWCLYPFVIVILILEKCQPMDLRTLLKPEPSKTFLTVLAFPCACKYSLCEPEILSNLLLEFHGVCLLFLSGSGSRLSSSGGGTCTSGEESSLEWSCAQLDTDEQPSSEEWLVRSKAAQLNPISHKTNFQYQSRVIQVLHAHAELYTFQWFPSKLWCVKQTLCWI